MNGTSRRLIANGDARQWLVRRFNLWDKGEIEYINTLLKKDVRNNSAWNHRFFVVFGREGEVSKEIVDREIKYNCSLWLFMVFLILTH